GRCDRIRSITESHITGRDCRLRECYCVITALELRVTTVVPPASVGPVTGSIETAATPARRILSSSAARGERSMTNRRVHGPRSLILTTTERRLSRWVTLA